MPRNHVPSLPPSTPLSLSYSQAAGGKAKRDPGDMIGSQAYISACCL